MFYWNSQGLAQTPTTHLLLKCLIIHSAWFYSNPWKLIFHFTVYHLLSQLCCLITAPRVSFSPRGQCSTSSLTSSMLPLIVNTQKHNPPFQSLFSTSSCFSFSFTCFKAFFFFFFFYSYHKGIWNGETCDSTRQDLLYISALQPSCFWWREQHKILSYKTNLVK